MDKYKSLMSVKTLDSLPIELALEHIGELTDISLDLRKIEGLRHAITLSEALQKRQMNPGQKAILHYFSANAWANLRSISRAGSKLVWDWEQKEIEKEIIHLRFALQEKGFQSLPKERQCQILTNLANCLNHVGRFVEAIEYWDKALEIVPSFAMALGNRGVALSYYAKALYDQGHTAVFLRQAHIDLSTTLSSALHTDAQRGFKKCQIQIESVLSPEYLAKGIDMYSFSLGDSESEIRYRKWCLSNRLFLNPLNDLGPYPIAARDVFHTPNIVVGIGEGPYYPGYFNQMKQEFVSARYLYYEGISARQPHFSDRDVRLFNTLDYPSYSLAVEKVKTAFRVAYSLLDKIAYFLNHYLHLSIPERKVALKTFWYASQSRDKGLRPEFQRCEIWPLRGLFWLSKDLYEDKPDFKESIEPDGQALSEIRNHLEHKYLKLHENDWPGPPSNNAEVSLALSDTLAFSISRGEFEAKTLKLLKMVRAALIYLSLAIHCEERQRAKRRDKNSIVPGMPLDIWEDGWKV